jgi:Uma2 family endonuclease
MSPTPASRRALSIEDRIDVPEEAFDLAGYRAWVKSAGPEGVRTAYVNGNVLIESSPEALERHNKVKTAITAAIAACVQEHDLGEVYSDRTLVTNEAARLSAEPDLTFVSWGSFDGGRARLVAKAGYPDEYVELVGSPDLVVEIVSDTSVRKDKTLLREAYARAGVREYWLIDARGAQVEFALLRLDAGEWRESLNPTGPQVSEVLPGTWTLSRSINRAGRFAYRLTFRTTIG